MRIAPRDGSDYGKSTAQLALLMASVVVLGFFLVAISLKFNGYGYPDLHYTWKALPLFIRHHGWHLLWIPVVWTLIAVWAQHRDHGELYRTVYWIGVCMLCSLITMYFWGALDNHTRRLILRREKPAPAPAISLEAPKPSMAP